MAALRSSSAAAAARVLATSSRPALGLQGASIRGFAQLADAAQKSQTASGEQTKMKTFQIYRWNPDTTTEKPRMENYTIDLNKTGPMVLDALIRIKNEIDPTLTFRR